MSETPFTVDISELRLEADTLQLKDPSAGKQWHELLDELDDVHGRDPEPLEGLLALSGEAYELLQGLAEEVEDEFETLDDEFDNYAAITKPTKKDLKALRESVKKMVTKALRRLEDAKTLGETMEKDFAACKKAGWMG